MVLQTQSQENGAKFPIATLSSNTLWVHTFVECRDVGLAPLNSPAVSVDVIAKPIKFTHCSLHLHKEAARVLEMGHVDHLLLD